MNFKDRVVLITGSSRGLGKQMALGFAKAGANVIVNYTNSAKEAENITELINSKFNRAISFKCDVGDIGKVEEMFNFAIQEFGRIDILINAAAIYEDAAVWNMTSDSWERVIKTDLTGVFNCTKFATKFMRLQKSGDKANRTF